MAKEEQKGFDKDLEKMDIIFTDRVGQGRNSWPERRCEQRYGEGKHRAGAEHSTQAFAVQGGKLDKMSS